MVLVEQFRFPVYASLNPEQKVGNGARKAWILEIVAGMVDPGRMEIEVANK